MGARATALITILTLGILFGLLYASDQSRYAINSHPNISRHEAIEIASNYAKSQIKGFQELTIMNVTDSRYDIRYPYTNVSLYVTELIFYHPNGTEFFVNPETNKVVYSCLPNVCSQKGLVYIINDTKSKGRLLYFIDGLESSNYTNYTYYKHGYRCSNIWGLYEIDAMTGQILDSPLDQQRANFDYKGCFMNPAG